MNAYSRGPMPWLGQRLASISWLRVARTTSSVEDGKWGGQNSSRPTRRSFDPCACHGRVIARIAYFSLSNCLSINLQGFSCAILPREEFRSP